MSALRIATDADLRVIDERYRRLYTDQLDRLGPQLGAFTDEQWRRPSRNRRWTLQQTMQHVAGVRIENVRRFDGEPATWPKAFDPNTTPQFDIETRAGETPAQTMHGLADSTRRLLAHLADRADLDEKRPMLWGEESDFRLFYLHVFWDSFIHERDVLLPLGIDPEPTDDQLGFATAYGLLIAGVAVRMAGGELRAEIDIADVGRTDLEVTADHIAVTIGDGHPGPGALRAPGGAALVDALSGRGDVADALEGPPDVLGALSQIGAFLAG